MISISTSQTFRSWVVIFHLRQPMEFLSLKLYDTPGLAPRMNVLYWVPGDFPVSYSNRDTSRNAWNRQSGSFMVDMGILFSGLLIHGGTIFYEIIPFLGHRSQRLQWPIVITRCPASVVRRPSVVCRPSSVVRLSSVVRRPSSVRQYTFSTSSPEPLDRFWWNLVWMKYSRSLTSVVVFRLDPPRGGSRAGPK